MTYKELKNLIRTQTDAVYGKGYRGVLGNLAAAFFEREGSQVNILRKTVTRKIATVCARLECSEKTLRRYLDHLDCIESTWKNRKLVYRFNPAPFMGKKKLAAFNKAQEEKAQLRRDKQAKLMRERRAKKKQEVLDAAVAAKVSELVLAVTGTVGVGATEEGTAGREQT
jgi:hypothetical protein